MSPVVVGLGIDLVEQDRVTSALSRWGTRFVQKLMDPAEMAGLPADAGERATRVALAIAAKEAASKAIGTGWSRGVRWRDVVVALDGPPAVTLHAEALVFARRLGSSGRTRLGLEVRGNLVLAEVRLLA
jgi:holo-[acyl-carrier protein] synthase